MQQAELAKLLALLAIIDIEQDEAVGYVPNRITDGSLGLINNLDECIRFTYLFQATERYVLGHNDVEVECFRTIPERLGNLIQPSNICLVGAHHEAEHKDNAQQTVILIEYATQVDVEFCDRFLVFPLVDFRGLNCFRQVSHQRLKALGDEDEILIQYLLKLFLARLCLFQSRNLCLLFWTQLSVLLDILVLEDRQNLIAENDHQLFAVGLDEARYFFVDSLLNLWIERLLLNRGLYVLEQLLI